MSLPGKLILYIIAFAAAALLAPLIGAEPLSGAEVIEYLKGTPNTDGEIFFYQRVPRVLLALASGGALAAVGAAFQVLFKNPLVEPYTLGITGGSALGAFIAISVPSLWVAWGPFTSSQLFAAVGSFATLALIYYLARRPEGMQVTTLLLIGVTISIFCGGAILLITYLASPSQVVMFQRWMMGGIDVVGYREVASVCPLLLPGLGLIIFRSNDLNHLSLGDEMALGHGVDVKRVQKDVFIGGGLATAAVVSIAGPISFVGLIVPHMVRRLSGFDQRIVLPGSFLLGGAALAACDTLARTIIAPTELPVGIITAVIGGPLFIRLLLSRRW